MGHVKLTKPDVLTRYQMVWLRGAVLEGDANPRLPWLAQHL